MKSLQSEITQVAAVCAAMLEDMQFGKAFGRALSEPESGLYEEQSKIIAEQIRAERDSQDYKWGVQQHTPAEWAMILIEEMGEVADALLASEFPTRESTQVSEEATRAFRVLSHIAQEGDTARHWCESHEWPERQKRVYDAAKENDEILPMGSGY